MSGRPLYMKLGIKSGMRMYINNAPSDYISLVQWDDDPFEILPDGSTELDFVHIFSTGEAHLIHQIAACLPQLKKTAMLWISWPKKSSSIDSSIDKWDVMRIGQESGLVDVKVCSVDKDWSGHKFVYRLKDRKN